MKWLNRIGLAASFAGAIALAGCSTTNSMMGRGKATWTMNNSAVTPGAQGKVEIMPGKNGNHEVKVEVEHLATAAEAYHGSSTYVVWLKPAGAPARNIGVLEPDKKEKAKLETSTPYTSFEVLVTAEAQPDATHPSDNMVLERRVEVAT
jgi:hypothetical protein